MFVKRVDYLSKIVPLGGILIVLCSAIKLNIYYSNFNINITEYLNLSEYPTLFIDDLLGYSIVFGVGLILAFLGDQDVQENTKLDYSKYKNKRRRLIITFIFISIITIILIIVVDSIIYKLSILKFASIPFLMNVYAYLLWVDTEFRFGFKFFIILAIIVYSLLDGYIDANKIIENQNEHLYLITYNNEIIETNNNMCFLGKSEKFIYLYRIKENESIILPIKKLEKLQVFDKRDINDNQNNFK